MDTTLFPPPTGLFSTLLEAQSEADVRQVVLAELPPAPLEHLGIDYLHENLLIEFKYSESMSDPNGKRSEILAQACYYCYLLRINEEHVPPYVALVDKKTVIVYQRQQLDPIFKKNAALFKNGTPSNPDAAVIELCKGIEPYYYQVMDSPKNCEKAIQHLQSVCNRQIFNFSNREEVDRYNAVEAFTAWCNWFDVHIKNVSTEHKPHVFRIDSREVGVIYIIQRSTTDENDDIICIQFDIEQEISQIENCKRSHYTDFWAKYWKRVTDQDEERAIFEKIYDLMDTSSRRRKGQFYTITPLAQRGWEYIEKVLGKDFYKDGTWRIWENSAGQGGLVINVIPHDALQYTYLSTIDNAEVAYLKIHVTEARKIFRFDFIDQQTYELPPELQRDMKDPNIKWLFFINPPYGEAGSGKATDDIAWHKAGVSQTLMRDRMGRYGMLRESKEKYAQFLFRIQDEFKGKFVLGIYCKIKAFISKEYVTLRKFWRPQFKCGFVCCAGKWHQSATNGQFPVAFSVFDCREKGKWQKMTYDILEYHKKHDHGVFKGQKSYVPEDMERSFRNYFFSSVNADDNEETVVQSNGLTSFKGKSVVSKFRPKDTLASVFFNSAYMLKQTYSWMVSGVSIHHNLFINRKNYKQFLCGLGLYWSIKHTWKNDPDCLLSPQRTLTKKEQADCMLLALLHERNRCTTAELPDTVIITASKKVVNGGLVKALLNPFDETLFDWKHLSPIGKQALEEYRHYCYDIVDWKHYETAAGRGIWGGHFLYERTKDGLDIKNKKPGDGYSLPKSFKDAREKLRQSVEQTALEVCF